MAYNPSLERVDTLLSQQTSSEQTNNTYTPTLNRVDTLMSANTSATPVVQQNTEDSRGFLNNFARHSGAVLGSFGRGLINTPNAMFSSIPKGTDLAGIPSDFDYYKALDIKRGLPDEIAESVLNFTPYLAGVSGAGRLLATGAGKAASYAPKLVKLFQRGVGSSLVQVPTANAVQAAVNANPGERGEKALQGAGWGLLSWGTGKVGDTLLRKGAERYAQSAIPTLVESATNKIKNYITPEQAAQKLQTNYNNAAAINLANWNKTKTLAATLDKSLLTQKTVPRKPSAILDAQGAPMFRSRTEMGVDFDNSLFTSGINKYLSQIKKLEPAERAQYENAMGFAQHMKTLAPQSFTGAVNLRQNLNQELRKYLEKNNVRMSDFQTKRLIGTLKNDLKKTVNTNAAKVNPQLFESFKNNWSNANRSHAGLQEFVKTPNAQGVLKPRVPKREAFNNQTLDAGALRQYVAPNLRGMEGINQLNKLTGSDNAARSYIMRNVIEGRGNPNAALNTYEKLAVPQRQALFDRMPEGEALRAASIARNKVGYLPEKKHWGGSFGHHVGAFGVPGGLTFLGSLAAGNNWEDAAKLGAMVGLTTTAGGAVPRALGRIATPNTVMKAVNHARMPSKNTGSVMSPVLQTLFPTGLEKKK